MTSIMKWSFCVVALVVVVALFVLAAWGGCDYLEVARQVLKEDSRFAKVVVSAPYPWPDVLLLNGLTRTEIDKWDSRDEIWKWTSKSGQCQPKGIINYIWSEEFRDAQTSRTVPPPGRLSTGSPGCWQWGEC